MKGVVLAGGNGTRLRPLTKMINKHLLPVGKFPMIHYAMEKLSEAGINDILLVIGKQSAGLYTDYLGNGAEWGIRLTYMIQEKSEGIAQALALAESYLIPGEKFVVLLGDNLFGETLLPYVEHFKKQESGAMVLLKEVEDPRRYGVPIFQEGRIVSIEEKPIHPSSCYSVTGIYFYDWAVFDIIRRLTPSARGELEITDVNNVYAACGILEHHLLSNWWIDAGTHDSLYEANKIIREEG